MFNIYSVDGRSFSGPLEELRRYRRVQQADVLQRSRKIEPALDEPATPSQGQAHYTAPDHAVASYKDMLRGTKAPEVAYHAYQIMSQPVITVSHRDTLQNVLSKFSERNMSIFPVINDRKQLIATLSRLELALALQTFDQFTDLRLKSVADLEISNHNAVITAAPVTDIRRICAVLLEESLYAMPIVDDNGHLVGIVTRSDLLHCLVNDPPLSLWC